MKPIIILFLAFIATTSCTIEKRIHNRGWNVQWHKQHRVAKTEVKEIKAKTDPVLVADLVEETVELKTNSVETEFQSETKPDHTAKIDRPNSNLNEDRVFQPNSENTIRKIDESVRENVVSETVQSPHFKSSHDSKRSPRGGKIAGIIFTILGIVGLLIGIGLLMFALTLTGSLEFLLALLGAIVFGLAGSILLIIGLTAFFASKKNETKVIQTEKS